MALLNNSKTLKHPPPRQQATPQHQSRAVLPDERKTVLRAPPRRIVVVLLPVQEEAGRVVVARQRRARNMVRGRKTARRMAGKQRRRGRISGRGSEQLVGQIFGGAGVGFNVQELAFLGWRSGWAMAHRYMGVFASQERPLLSGLHYQRWIGS
jgi:hypothetical protein